MWQVVISVYSLCRKSFLMQTPLSQVPPYQSVRKFVIFLDFHSTKQGSHWLILGHMALTKIKCIPIVIH